MDIEGFIEKFSAISKNYELFESGVCVTEGDRGASYYHHAADHLRDLGIEFEGSYRDSTHIFPNLKIWLDGEGKERVTSKEGRDYFVRRMNGRAYLSDAGSPQPRLYWVQETITDGESEFTIYGLKDGKPGKKPLSLFKHCNHGIDPDGHEYIYATRIKEYDRRNFTKFYVERADDGNIYLRSAKNVVGSKELVYEVEGDIDNVRYKPRSYRVYKLRKNGGQLDPGKDYRVFQYMTQGRKAVYKIRQEGKSTNPLMRILLGHVLKSLEDNPGFDAIDVWSRIFLKFIVKGADPDLSVISFYESLPDFEHVGAFERLLTYILDHQPVQFEYFSKNANKMRHVYMHPYMFKNYNKRWYLIGRELADECDPLGRTLRYKSEYSHCKTHPVSCLALDGITPESIEEWPFVDFEEWGERPIDYFEGIIGVTPHKDGEQNAILRFTKYRYQYVSTKPLTDNQEEIKPGEEFFDSERPTIRLSVHFNRELLQQILSFGPDVEVVYPQSLRDKLAEMVQSMWNMYR